MRSFCPHARSENMEGVTWFHSFVISAKNGDEFHAPVPLYPEKQNSSIDSEAAKSFTLFSGTEPRVFGHPA